MQHPITGKLLRLLGATALLLSISGMATAQVAGIKNIPGDYVDLAAAITDLNTVGVGVGGVTINVLAGNPQTSPAGGYAINLLASNATAANAITIRGNGNTVTAPTTHVVGALTDAIFKIIGEDFVTIDGFVMNENAANTTIVAASNNMTEFGVALFYRTATDGAQSASLLGNTITLNRTYQNTFGIYSNSTHTATVATTTANASGAAGGNSALAIRGNTISNVNIGIVVVGSAGTAADHNEGLDIGGASLATGNTITNYGTTGTFSAYANVSGTVNGILVRNTRNLNISFNTITSSAGGTTVGTLRGVFVPAFSTAPTGTLTSTINNNRISVRSGVVTGTLAGIIVESGSLTATSSITVNTNTFIDSGYSVASASGVSTFLSVAGSGTAGPLNTTINNNSFDNLSIASSGSLTLIFNSFTRPANGTITANNNAIGTGLVKTLAGGTVTGYTNNSASPNTVTEVNSGNNLSNITLSGTGATVFMGWQSNDGATPGSRKTVTNNTVSNVSNATTGANTGMNVGFSDNTFAGNEVSGNTISNISSTSATSTAALIGISSISGNQNLTNNTVHSLSAAGLNTVSGISIGGGTTQNLSRNRIYNLSQINAGGFVNGIVVTTGTTINVFNNIMGDLRATAANAANPVVGINITGGTTVNADYNSVFLTATSSGALFGSSALSASVTPTVTLRNNNLINGSTANGTGVSAAYRRSTATLTTYGALSNNNNLFGAALFTDGTNTDATIAAFRVRMSPRDGVSITENSPFISTLGSDPNFLNISTVTPTRLESGATPVAGITTDFAGLPRNATTPDIGAWEFAGILLDEVPPSIVYTPLLNTISLANRAIAVSISDASGVASGGNAPRIYFRKGAGAYASTTCAGTAPAFTCSIDYSLIGGAVASDVIGYFVIAQDTLGNIGAVPGAGLVASNVNTITTPPTTPASYTVLAPFPGAVNVGPAEAITSLTNAGGLFEALNNGVLNSNVAVTITGDLTAELGTVVLNQLVEEGVGAGTYTLTIQPSGVREVRGAAVARLIDFNGTDRVTIDGLNAAGNSLLIRNEGIGEIVRYINDASGNSLLNCALEGGAGVTAVNVSTGTVTGNDNIRIAGNIVRGFPFNSIGSTSASATVLTSNLTIENNLVVNFAQAGIFIGVGTENVTIAGNQIRQTAPRATSLLGIAINGMSGNNVVRNNEIRDLETTLAAGTLTGISAGTSVGTNRYTENTIRDLRFSGTTGTTVGFSIGDVRTGVFARNRIFGLQSNAAATGALIGIRFNGSIAQPSNATVINNYIALAPTAVGAFQVIGIFDFAFANNTFTADYNSVFVAGTASSAASSWAYQRGGGTPTFSTLRNNIFYNNRSGGTGSHFAIGDQSVNTGTWTSNNNVYFGTGATPASYFDLGTLAAGTPVGFATWQAGPPTRDANSVTALASSITLANFFVDAANGNLNLLATGTQAINAGTPIAGITTDINGDPRSASAPEIGADELVDPNTAPSITPAVGISRQAGTAGSNSIIATVSDAEQAAGSLIVTAPSVPTGLMLSGIVNAAGTVGASLAATCSATVGANNVGLSVSDGSLSTAGNLSVNVTANGVPVLGSYGASTATTGSGTTVTPGAVPTDNGSVVTLTAAAPGFTGTFSGNPSTGVITVSNAGPGSATPYVVTVTATDNCGSTSTTTFNLTVSDANTAPTITPAIGVARQQGSAPGNSTIAIVADAESAAGSLVVTAPSVPAGLTVTNIANGAGTVTANLSATCSAPLGAASVGLSVSDGSLSNAGNLMVNVTVNTAPTLASYPASTVTVSGNTSVTPSTVPADNGSVSTLSASAPGFTGSFTGNPLTGVILVTNAGPASATPYVVTVTATDNCGATSTATFNLAVGSIATTLTLSGPATARVTTPVTYTFGLAPAAATGTVTISSGAVSCVVNVPTATPSCALTFPTVGVRSVAATFAPADASYAASTSNTVSTTVHFSADLAVTKDNGVSTYRVGDLLVYTIVLRNLGPDAAPGSVLTDNVPAGLIVATWTCTSAGGAVCPQAAGSGDINATVATLPANSSLTYILQANVASPLPPEIVNTAQVMLNGPFIIDPILSNQSATDRDLPDAIFRNGFEDSARSLISRENAQVMLPLSAMRALMDGTARALVSYDDANGEAIRLYGRIVDDGVELAIAQRDSVGLLRLGTWQPFSSAEATLNYRAVVDGSGWVLQSANF